MPRKTSHRDIWLLAGCQALLLTNAAGLISMNALVGFSLTDVKTIATLGATTYVLGSAVATMPASLWMARVGRRTGFMTGALVNVAGCGIAVLALVIRSFPLFCVATAVIGVYNAIGLQYRFAAAEVAAPHDRAKAISLVLAGGIVGGFLGPTFRRCGERDLFPVPFLGSFLVLAGWALVALALHFVFALALVGVGWNFVYTGATALLTESLPAAEKAKTQGANDLVLFTTMGLSSFSSGLLVSTAGWTWMNVAALPVLGVIVAAVLWLGAKRRTVARPA